MASRQIRHLYCFQALVLDYDANAFIRSVSISRPKPGPVAIVMWPSLNSNGSLNIVFNSGRTPVNSCG